MKILFLSFYYEPDLSAGSFRATALIDELKKKDVVIDIMTTLPNRYSSFAIHAKDSEQKENVHIKRIALPGHKSGMADQIKAFYTYYKEVNKLVKNTDYDLVYATSSRLFTAFLGARIARKKKIPLYLDIRDIFVDTIKDVLNPKIAFFAKPVFTLIEKYTFSKAMHINLVSEGFKDYFLSRYKNSNYSWFTNGIDDEFLGQDYYDSEITNKKIKILYAGNIGEGQGLHTIIPGLAGALKDEAEFIVVGSGGRLVQLEKSLQVSQAQDLKVQSPVKRMELLKLYKESDILFLHLNDYPAFKKVLPSKIFEYAATGKPILAGVSGFSADFLNKEVINSAVFHPSDVTGAIAAFKKLKIADTDRKVFIEKFRRKKIMIEMAENIYGYIKSKESSKSLN